MRYIKLYEDLYVTPDGKLKEIYCQPHDVIFDMFNWLDKLEEKEPDYESIITRLKKDLDRGKIDPHDIINPDTVFLSEEDVLDYLLNIVIEYNKKRS
jgi:hypothetical protein